MEFKQVENFKYLGVKLNVQGKTHKEILNRIDSVKCFFGLKIILKSKLYQSDLNYKVMICLIALSYVYETWPQQKQTNRTQIREKDVYNKFLALEEYERRKNKDLIITLEDSNIIAMMKSKWMDWEGNVRRGREQNIGKVISWRPKGKRPLSCQRPGYAGNYER